MSFNLTIKTPLVISIGLEISPIFIFFKLSSIIFERLNSSIQPIFPEFSLDAEAL